MSRKKETQERFSFSQILPASFSYFSFIFRMSFLSVLSFSNFLFYRKSASEAHPCTSLPAWKSRVPDIVRLAAPAFWSERPDRMPAAHGLQRYNHRNPHRGHRIACSTHDAGKRLCYCHGNIADRKDLHHIGT